MYRDVARCEDRPIMASHGLRFDITLIPPGMIGQEYNKTVGHYHPVKPGTVYTYPEVYEVLHGEAAYLLQRPSVFKGEVDDVVVVAASAGDKVVIPPGYGHITINAGVEPLLMANWVASEFDSVYGEIKELRGGAYYLMAMGGTPGWIHNQRYMSRLPIRFDETRNYPEFGLMHGEPMYKLIIEAPEKLRFLTHPEEYQWVAATQE
ncbi:MAG: glucose-6-phosphate isomerase family protein, partial [Bacillota bacterium]|nr:glucose-6-phosphate isomerase family protein [Bacillota bacterium]